VDRSASPPSPAQVTLEDYVLSDKIGRGGSGTVYKAWQLSLQRFVAIKLVDPGSAVDSERFEREARMAARLDHPHIVPIHQIGEFEGRHFLAMRLIDGESLDRVRVSPRQAVTLMCQAINAMDYAHQRGVVHRDLKPQNLILERGGEHVWVTDFGLARSLTRGATVTAMGNVVGTPAYMPPEQARGRRCDERSDVYSLGATLYELLTGRAPFEGEDLLALMTRVFTTDPAPLRSHDPNLAPALEVIVSKAMAKEPRQRYQSARELEADLRRHLASEPIMARPPTVARRTLTWVRRHPLASAAVAFACTLVTAQMVSGVMHTRRLQRQLAETMVAEANALGAAGQWESARVRYHDAEAAFARLGETNAGPGLGLLDAQRHAPPALLTMKAHLGPVCSVAFLPDGKRALSAGEDGSVRIWDVTLGRTTRVFEGPPSPLASLALSADGRRAVSGGPDGTIVWWDVEAGRRLRAIPSGKGAVLRVAISPDGSRALSRTENDVQLWELATGQRLREITGVPRRVATLAFSPDGRYALTARKKEDKGEILDSRASLWELATGREVQSLGPFFSDLKAVAFSPDGRHLLTGGQDRELSLWDLESGRRLLALDGHHHILMGVAFSPQNRALVSGAQDQTVRLWNADDGKLLRTLETGHEVLAMGLSPDGKALLTGGDDGSIKLWDLTVGGEARLFTGHENSALTAVFTPDDRLALSGGLDRRLRLWDVATGQEIVSLDTSRAVLALAISPSGKLVATGSSAHTVRLWALPSGRQVRELQGSGGSIHSLSFSPDNRLLIAGSERGGFIVWEAETGKLVRAWNHPGDARGAVIGPSGKIVLTASGEASARLWDLNTGRPIGELRSGPTEHVNAVAISANGRLAATGSNARAIRLWELPSGRPLRNLTGHTSDVRILRFSPGGELLFSTSRDGTMRVWDTATGQGLHAFSWLPNSVRAFALSPDGRLALGGNDDGALALWDFDLVRKDLAMREKLTGALATLEHRPDDPAALAQLGEWYAFRGVCGWAIDLLQRAEAAGATVSPLMLARCHWRQGDLTAAHRELERAQARAEAPAEYLQLLERHIESPDQAQRLSQLSLKDGRVRFPFLGIRAGARFTTGADPAPAAGALITHVMPDSPARRAGLRAGDRLMTIDGKPIADEAKLGSYLASRTAGASVKLAFQRGDVTRTIEATLADRPPRLWEPEATPLVEPAGGYSLQTLQPTLARVLGLDPELRGAIITRASIHSPLSVANKLKIEDVIVAVDGQPVTTAEGAAAALAALPAEGWNRVQIVRPGAVR
jgi:WD40 repeat protein/predicted Ser/Thr protein kinase